MSGYDSERAAAREREQKVRARNTSISSNAASHSAKSKSKGSRQASSQFHTMIDISIRIPPPRRKRVRSARRTIYRKTEDENHDLRTAVERTWRSSLSEYDIVAGRGRD